MRNTREKVIENEIKTWMKTEGLYFFKNLGGHMTEPGRPDIVACINGRFVAIETKRERNGIQSEAQKYHEYRITENGGIYILTNNSNNCIQIIMDIQKGEI